MSPVPADARLAFDRCEELGGITSVPGTITRLHLSAEHAWANALVARWMRSAGLRTWVDAAGNLCGRLEGREPGLPAVVLGSHIDTVPDAGRYDGPLGVMLALGVARRLRNRMENSPHALEVVAFSDEEGARFGSALMGSRAFAGTWDDAWFDQTDEAGMTLRRAFADFGLDPHQVGAAAREPSDVVAYLEAHIEQGPLLQDAGRSLGVVTSIAGARRFALTVTGEARHAGGTPYDRRRDALVGASFAVIAVEDIAKRRDVIATVGQLQAHPGAVNVVPGRVEFSLDLRAADDPARDAAWEEMLATITSVCDERGLQFHWVEEHRAPAVVCAPWLQDVIRDAVAGVELAAGAEDPAPAPGAGTAARASGPVPPVEVPELYSRAGHDAMAVAHLTEVGMLFIRCLDGISHSPFESVTVDDVADALDAFTSATAAVLATERS
ncbi:Zn-dependent hydrolase [Propioniciclava soli]|uniref:Zn-dependent hydrolase n=1 Tax=Propioniciclava soli TaxID=2775081 RepID=A0ABZ3CAD8_9ACTN